MAAHERRSLAELAALWGAGLPGYSQLSPAGVRLLGKCLLGGAEPPAEEDWFVEVARASGQDTHRYPITGSTTAGDMCVEVGRRLGWPSDEVVLLHGKKQMHSTECVWDLRNPDALIAVRGTMSAAELRLAIADFGGPTHRCRRRVRHDPPASCVLTFQEDTPIHIPSVSITIPPAIGRARTLRKLVVAPYRDYSRQARIKSGPVTVCHGDVFPTELGRLNNLQMLIMAQCGLTAAIPTEIGQMARLETLDLHVNRLTGKIPTEMGLLSELCTLILHTNHLTGSVPKELKQCERLSFLRLHENRLEPEAPWDLWRTMIYR